MASVDVSLASIALNEMGYVLKENYSNEVHYF